MALPEGFIFSQSSLQDYADCARRFQLRYLLGCRWPAPEAADALEFERQLQRGYEFHRLMSRLYSGVPAEALRHAASADPDLAHWWSNYQDTPPQDLPAAVREAEVTLTTALGKYRLEARYDLLAGQPGGHWVIVDWKTGQHRTPRAVLRQRLQTRIYPLVLVEAGATLNGGLSIAPEQVEMLYWFAGFPAQPERFAYGEEQFVADRNFLEGLLREVETRPEDAFPQTEDRRLCNYCVYRSLCWQDVQAGALANLEELEPSAAALEDLDLEAIAPIPF